MDCLHLKKKLLEPLSSSMAELPLLHNNPPREFLDNHAAESMLPSTNDELVFDPIDDKYQRKENIPE